MIQKSFLTEIANYTNGEIAKVVLNDTFQITDFVIKEVTETTVAMQYLIPVASLSLVTKIDLKDSANRVISTNDVYIPIASDTLILHTFAIREVQ